MYNFYDQLSNVSEKLLPLSVGSTFSDGASFHIVMEVPVAEGDQSGVNFHKRADELATEIYQILEIARPDEADQIAINNSLIIEKLIDSSPTLVIDILKNQLTAYSHFRDGQPHGEKPSSFLDGLSKIVGAVDYVVSTPPRLLAKGLALSGGLVYDGATSLAPSLKDNWLLNLLPDRASIPDSRIVQAVVSVAVATAIPTHAVGAFFRLVLFGYQGIATAQFGISGVKDFIEAFKKWNEEAQQPKSKSWCPPSVRKAILGSVKLMLAYYFGKDAISKVPQAQKDAVQVYESVRDSMVDLQDYVGNQLRYFGDSMKRSAAETATKTAVAQEVVGDVASKAAQANQIVADMMADTKGLAAMVKVSKSALEGNPEGLALADKVLASIEDGTATAEQVLKYMELVGKSDAAGKFLSGINVAEHAHHISRRSVINPNECGSLIDQDCAVSINEFVAKNSTNGDAGVRFLVNQWNELPGVEQIIQGTEDQLAQGSYCGVPGPGNTGQLNALNTLLRIIKEQSQTCQKDAALAAIGDQATTTTTTTTTTPAPPQESSSGRDLTWLWIALAYVTGTTIGSEGMRQEQRENLAARDEAGHRHCAQTCGEVTRLISKIVRYPSTLFIGAIGDCIEKRHGGSGNAVRHFGDFTIPPANRGGDRAGDLHAAPRADGRGRPVFGAYDEAAPAERNAWDGDLGVPRGAWDRESYL
jgi:hypothetical protein